MQRVNFDKLLRWARHRRVWRVVLACLVLPPLLLIALAAATPLPSELREDHRFDSSIRVVDRHGKVLAEVRADDGARSRWIRLDEVSADVPLALIAAEDKRFRRHPGIDPIAILRAMGQNLAQRRIVSGASTLTQQLARNLVFRERTLLGKTKEMAVALRIEASLSKDEILEAYLNRVHFGPSLRGLEAASRFYFDKPSRSLSLAEAATLAAMPRGPSLYDPRVHPDRLRARRDVILDRMLERGADPERVAMAKQEALTVHAKATGWGAPHLVRGLLSGRAQPELGPLEGHVSELRITIDGDLQREAQTAARALVGSLHERHVTAASVVVLDNATGEVLVWVGAHDFFDDKAGGQNDGVIALRQPGSTLKPFVYATAIDDLGWTPATVLPDVELQLVGMDGSYTPHNYDGRFHGPVRMREALANSYNIPAVYTASAVGPSRVLSQLRELGFTSLEQDADHYGAAIALGDGEVRLLDLANAYATLARGGMWVSPHALRAAVNEHNEPIAVVAATRRRVMPATTARLLLDVLSDPHARLASFGPDSPLVFSFPVAAKTGTSKGFRDNLTVGCTPEVTVAVWVGNFDGSPMEGVSGITGAGPLFHAVMETVSRRKHEHADFPLDKERFERVEVCALSGLRPTDACSHRTTELFAKGSAPERTCDMHERVAIDTRNGLRAGEGCDRRFVREQVFEVFEGRFRAWAMGSGRPLAPTSFSPLCPGSEGAGDAGPAGRIVMRYPYAGAVYLQDPSLPNTAQGLVLRADAPASVRRLSFVVDGKPMATAAAPFEQVIRLSAGEHTVWAQAPSGARSESVTFEVR